MARAVAQNNPIECFACRKELRDCTPNIGGSRPSGRRRRQTSCVTPSLRAQCWKWPRSTKRWPSVRLGGKSFDIFRTNGPPQSKSDSLERFPGSGVTHHQPRAKSIPRAEKRHSVDVGCLTYFDSASLDGRANASTRGELQSFQPVQQSAHTGWTPFVAPCRWYLSRVQLSHDCLDGNKPRFTKFANGWTYGLGSCVRGLPACLSVRA
jgi:hypothetical protein